MISSGWFLFYEEIVKVKHYLEKNYYPLGLFIKKLSSFLRIKKMRKGLQLILQTMLLGTTNCLILAIFQQMSNVILIGFVNFIAKVSVLRLF